MSGWPQYHCYENAYLDMSGWPQYHCYENAYLDMSGWPPYHWSKKSRPNWAKKKETFSRHIVLQSKEIQAIPWLPSCVCGQQEYDDNMEQEINIRQTKIKRPQTMAWAQRNYIYKPCKSCIHININKDSKCSNILSLITRKVLVNSLSTISLGECFKLLMRASYSLTAFFNVWQQLHH